MHRMIWLFTLVLFGAAVANAQEPRPPKVPINPEEAIEAPNPAKVPKVVQPDTTLLDDTKASGLQPRVRAVPRRAADQILPMKRRCLVITVTPGAQFTGELTSTMGPWLHMKRDDGREVWIASENVAAVVFEPDREPRKDSDKEAAAQAGEREGAERERSFALALKAEAEAMRREVMAMQQRLVQAVEEAARARRESESQRDMAEQLRRRAEEARAVLTEEVARLREQLRKAAENAAKENTKEEPKE